MHIVLIGLLLPLVGTSIGALISIFFSNKMKSSVFNLLSGFAAGVMVAASIWSLLIPSIEMSANLGTFKVFPALIGFILGMILLSLFEKMFEKKEVNMLNFAVIIHNIPEGLCVGCAFASVLTNNYDYLMGAFILSLGISIQNIPEGSIISLNMLKDNSKVKSIISGILSGIVEPIASIIAILLVYFVKPLLPYTLSFAAGAMIYVVIDELIPKSYGSYCNYGFCIGFSIMMLLDIILG